MAQLAELLSPLVGSILLLSTLATHRLVASVDQRGQSTDRVAAGHPVTASLACLDSQNVRLASRIFEDWGLDGGKHINGRRRQILTDVQGRILACLVHTAYGHDGVEALRLLPALPRASGW